MMANEVWEELYDRLAELVQGHRTTLIFVNTRRLAERAARHLSDRIGKEHVMSHHGSLAKESRFDAEQRLKRGELKALVATASLELGIDIGDVDLVCQLGSPRSIATFLQRAGRAGHSVTGTPKARLFPLTRDELIECTALLHSIEQGDLDRLRIPPKPLDVLAQQIVAEVAGRTSSELENRRADLHPHPNPPPPRGGGMGGGSGERVSPPADLHVFTETSDAEPHASTDGEQEPETVPDLAGGGVSEQWLYETLRRAYPYRELKREEYKDVVRMLADGFATRRGRRSAYLHRDAVNGVLRARKGARLTALTNGGAIPDTADYRVVLEPSGTPVGTVNEDFAVESMSGDIFQLGNTSYRILKVEPGTVRVEDAKGQPPSIPFWLGEAPARTDELSAAVSRLREEVDRELSTPTPTLPRDGDVQGRTKMTEAQDALARSEGRQGTAEMTGAPTATTDTPTPTLPRFAGEGREGADRAAEATASVNATTSHLTSASLQHARDWLAENYRLTPSAAEQIVDYLAAAKGVLHVVPTQTNVVFERFFDETGGMQLVIHAPFGNRINRAWGLALRKRFCRKFNFELQAAATEDAIVLSLGETHSFPLEEVARYLHSNSVRDILIQALLAAPLFTTRWRWNATISLAVKRFRGGRKNPAPLQRMDAEDLVAVVFPDQIACAENLAGEREIPDHPLVRQTIDDCLHEAMDIDGLVALLKRIEAGQVNIIARDLPHPSPLAQEILNAKPYAFLDDAPLEERRTQAVMSRSWLDPLAAGDLGRLDPDAIARVRTEAWPEIASADELHDALMLLGFVDEREGDASGWRAHLDELIAARRATRVQADRSPPRCNDVQGSTEIGLARPCATAKLGLLSGIAGAQGEPERDEGPADLRPGERARQEPSPGFRAQQDCAAKKARSDAEMGGGTFETLSDSAERIYWVAAEQLPLLRALHPGARLNPEIQTPAEYTREWTREAALVEILRARLQGLGPVTVDALAQSLGADASEIQTALLALESEGFVMRGEFSSHSPSPAVAGEGWGGGNDAKTYAVSDERPPSSFLPPQAGEGGEPTRALRARTQPNVEWCERRLLARIHRYTVDRLRAEIEPVAASDFLRFLFEWQGVTAEPRAEGPQALGSIIEQLQGFEAAATAWESEILRARMEGYDPDWLDDLCRAGRVVWARLTPPKVNGGERAAGPVRSTPITLLPRREWRYWQTAATKSDAEPARPSSRAQAVAEFLEQHGASFFEEITSGTNLLKSEVEEALGELVALGRVQSDSFDGLRALLIPADKRRTGYRRRRIANAIEEAGRWSLLRSPSLSLPRGGDVQGRTKIARDRMSGAIQRVGVGASGSPPSPSLPPQAKEGSVPKRADARTEDTTEHIARALLRRYGVVFRKLLTREIDRLPPWIELLRVYRRLEARGEIRGGRFVAGFSGEQYALPEAVPMLRTVRRKPKNEQFVSLSAADPLNLIGILTPGGRVPALAGNRVLYRDGVPVAIQVGGKTEFLIDVPEQDAWNARNALIRGVANASSASH
ncbi:MAG: helicase-related protein [Sulfurifustis sp.]